MQLGSVKRLVRGVEVRALRWQGRSAVLARGQGIRIGSMPAANRQEAERAEHEQQDEPGADCREALDGGEARLCRWACVNAAPLRPGVCSKVVAESTGRTRNGLGARRSRRSGTRFDTGNSRHLHVVVLVYLFVNRGAGRRN